MRGTIMILLFAGLVSTCPPAKVWAEDILVWSDEFDGTAVDTDKWEFMIGDGSAYGVAGWGNNEWQYYTSRPENCYVADGLLHIVARREPYGGMDYTSARLRTEGKAEFRYGRLEARLKLPSGQGIWPAFWMLPTNSPYGGWAAGGEIDIMESVNLATTTYGTLHYGGNWPENAHSGGNHSDGTDYSQDFHVFAIEWLPDAIHWYVDDIYFHTETSSTWYSTAAPDNPRAPFDHYFHFLLNVAVGGNWPGYPDDGTPFPMEMVVDYVRVYSYFPVQGPFNGQPHPLPGAIEVEDYDLGGEGVAYHDCDADNNGGAYRPAGGVDIEDCSEGGYNIGWMCANEWLEYTVDVQHSGTYTIQARVASESTGGSFHLEFDEADLTGAIDVPVTGGWQNWTTVTTTTQLQAGEQVMRLVNADSSDEYNFNHLNFIYHDPADFDQDGAVDLDDYALFRRCFNGPNHFDAPDGCTPGEFYVADLDGDGDVDVGDFQCFQWSWSLR